MRVAASGIRYAPLIIMTWTRPVPSSTCFRNQVRSPDYHDMDEASVGTTRGSGPLVGRDRLLECSACNNFLLF